jgi:RHS repeat-associated protein
MTVPSPRLAALLALALCAPVPALGADKAAFGPTKVKLPSGPGSLEGVGENVEPNFTLGQASYGVAIAVPSGYGALTPSLRLGYSSGAGNGVAGIGWNLAVPSIERTTKRGLPRYDRNDTWAADGGSELVRLPGGLMYRARFEGAFVRYTWIEAAGDGKAGYWKAEYPDGRVGYFGADERGNVDISARVTGGAGVFRYMLVAMTDRLGHAARYRYAKDGNATYLSAVEWVEDAAQAMKYRVEMTYESRPDALTDVKPGAPVVWGKRLTGARVLVRGTQLRRYALRYEPEAQTGGLSRLAEVTQYGLNDEGPYPIRFGFSYSESFATAAPQVFSFTNGAGVDMRNGSADLVDLDGDGLLDVLDTAGASMRLIASQRASNGAFSWNAPENLSGGALALTSPAVQLFDLDGNGFADLVDGAQRMALLGKGTGQFSSYSASPATNVPNVAADAALRTCDVDGDKRIDFLRLGASGRWWVQNLGNGTFAQRALDDSLEPVPTFDQGAELADMNGDGLVDLVLQGQGFLAYWPSAGYGRYLARVEMTGVPQNPAAEHRLADIDGDGLADHVEVAGLTITVRRNKSGIGFENARVFSASSSLPIPERTSATSVRFADMNGNGTSDVVYFDASGHTTVVELYTHRPNLLTRITNGIGKVLELGYGTSVEHMARDGGPSSWLYRLPQPMATVESLATVDARTGVRQLRRVAYRDGYWDADDKQFGGFARVTVTSTGDASMESGVQDLRFDVGASDRYRRGLMTLEETAGAVSGVLATKQTTYADCTLSGVPTTLDIPVRFLCATAVESVLKEARPAAEWITTREEKTYDGFGNVTKESKLGVVAVGGGACPAYSGNAGDFGVPRGSTCTGDEAFVETTFITPNVDFDPWILHAPAKVVTYASPTGRKREQRTYYDGAEFLGLPLGSIARGLVTRTTTLDEQGREIPAARTRFGANGEALEVRDALGHGRTFTYDRTGLLPLSERVTLDDGATLTTSVAMHPVLDAVVRGTSWSYASGTFAESGAETQIAYDAFGRIAAMALPGDTLDAPTEAYDYVLAAPESRIVKRARSRSGGAFDLEEVQCFDGLGRKTETRTLLDGSRYQVSGTSIFNALGKPAIAFEPFLGDGSACSGAAPSGAVNRTATSFDALGRPLAITLPRDAGEPLAVKRVAYLPLASWTTDELGRRTLERQDGLGRVLISTRAVGSPAESTTALLYDDLGAKAGIVDGAGIAKRHTLDLLGRLVRIDDPDAGTLRFAYDDAGNLLRETDARGRTIVHTYDAANRELTSTEESREAESRVSFEYDRAASCAACTHTAGRVARVTYGLGPGAVGDGVDELAYDARGQGVGLARTLPMPVDAGARTFTFGTAFDNVGRVVSRTLPTGRTIAMRYDAAGRMAAVDDFVSAVAYEGRGLPETVTYGNGLRAENRYDARMRLTRGTVVGAGGSALQDLAYRYDAASQLVGVDDAQAADGAPSFRAEYTYDGLGRVTRASLDAGRPTSEVQDFAYDAASRLLAKTSSNAASKAHVGAYRYGEGAGPHAVTTAGSEAIAYDAGGFMRERRGVGGSTWAYAWDGRGRLASVSRDADVVQTSSYDAAGVRVVKREGASTTLYLAPDFEVRDGLATTYVKAGHTSIARVEEPAFATTFFPDVAPLGSGTAAEPAPDGIITAADAWVVQAAKSGLVDLPPPAAAKAKTADVDKMLASAARRMLGADATQTTYASHDHLGSPSLETNERGEVVARRWHGPYGEVRGASGAWAEARGFTGKERDETTGLADHGARYLDTRLGRWTAPDPLAVRELGGAELDVYGYVEGRVTSATDPTGLWSSKDVRLPVAFVYFDMNTGFHAGIRTHYEFEPVHQLAIDRAVPALPSAMRKVLKDAQVIADKEQRQEFQYRHAMHADESVRGRSVSDDVKLANAFIRANLTASRRLLEVATGRREGERITTHDLEAALTGRNRAVALKAMEFAGAAVHVTQDSTSPAHRGMQVFRTIEAMDHVYAENQYPASGSNDERHLLGATLGPISDVLEGKIRDVYLDARGEYVANDRSQ